MCVCIWGGVVCMELEEKSKGGMIKIHCMQV